MTIIFNKMAKIMATTKIATIYYHMKEHFLKAIIPLLCFN